MWSSLICVCSRCNVGYFFHSSSFWGSLAQGLVFVSMRFNNATSYNSLSTQSIFVSSTWACLPYILEHLLKLKLFSEQESLPSGPMNLKYPCSKGPDYPVFTILTGCCILVLMIAIDYRKQTFIVSVRMVLKQPNKILLTIWLYKGILTTQKYSVGIWWYIVFKICRRNGFIWC